MEWFFNEEAQVTESIVCEGTEISINTSLPEPPRGSYLIVTLQRFEDGWQDEAVFTSNPTSGAGTMSLMYYNTLFTLDMLNPQNGNVPFPGHGEHTYRVKVELFNGSTGTLDPNSPKFTDPFNITLKQDEPADGDALYLNGRIGVEKSTGAQVASKCTDPFDFAVDVDRSHDNYWIPYYEVYQSNRDGDPVSLIYSRSFSSGGPIPTTFFQILNSLSQDLRSTIQNQSSGYFLIQAEIQDDCSNNAPVDLALHYKVNEAPNVLDFELIYEDPNNSGSSGGFYPWDETVVQNPSADLANPVDIGSSTGALYIFTANTNYDSFTLEVEKFNQLTQAFDPVGSETGQPSPFPAYHRLGNPQIYSNPADNPANNIGVTYRAEITLNTQGCNPIIRSTYFRMPSSLQFFKYAGTSKPGNWHSTNYQEQSITVHLKPEASSEALARLQLYSMDGRLLYEENRWQKGTQKTPSLGLPTGIYLLRMSDQEGRTLYQEKVSL